MTPDGENECQYYTSHERLDKDVKDLEVEMKTFKKVIYEKFENWQKKGDRITYLFIAQLIMFILILLKEYVIKAPVP